MTPAETVRARLGLALTTYDRRQSGRRGWNPYALPQYLARADEIAADIEAGASPRAAILAGFTGTLQAACLRALGLPPATADERNGAGRLVYTPASERGSR